MYTPDRWVVIDIAGVDGSKAHKRVLAGWYGGYLDGDRWQMNSGIVKTIDHGDFYDFHGESGSVYRCYKASYGMSSYMSSIYNSYKKEADADGIKFEIDKKYQPKVESDGKVC